jgi:hypothetical protein
VDSCVLGSLTDFAPALHWDCGGLEVDFSSYGYLIAVGFSSLTPNTPVVRLRVGNGSDEWGPSAAHDALESVCLHVGDDMWAIPLHLVQLPYPARCRTPMVRTTGTS